MTYDPAKTGEAPVIWGAGTPASDPKGEAEVRQRTLGFRAEDLAGAAWLPDDMSGLSAALLDDGRPFNGAFVPLVVHDPLLAERSYDAAEWAADLISGAGGRLLGVAPFAEKGWAEDRPLSPRQWNHMAAMIERLDDLCGRFKLRAVVSDSIGDQQVRHDGGLESETPLHYVLDAGSFVPDGFVLVQLLSPERLDPAPGGLRRLLKGNR